MPHEENWGDGRTSVTSINKAAIQLQLIKFANPRLLLPAHCQFIHFQVHYGPKIQAEFLSISSGDKGIETHIPQRRRGGK